MQRFTNNKTLIALKKSIAHWERLASGKRKRGERIGAKSCALCGEFNIHNTKCFGCPVRDKTGKPYCENTPYEQIQFTEPNQYRNKSFIKAAKEELKFLKTLLPK